MLKWLLILLPTLVFADIGLISEFRGNGEIIRQNTTDKLLAELALDIFPNDDVRTGNGRIAIKFTDDTEVRLTEHSKLIITEYIFNPNKLDTGKLSLNFIKGTGRFISSKNKLIKRENISIRANGAVIGIRGTDFSITSDELGRTMLVLLPNPDGTSSGSITVTTMAGTVVLTEAFEATVVTVAEQMPTKPVVLTGMTLDFIDNMLIVNPPEETEKAVAEQNASNNLLDTEILEENEIDKDYLDEEFEEVDRLTIDLLNVDFLTDLLNIIDDSVGAKAQVSILNGVEIEGVKAGFDPINQSYTFVEGSILTFFRAVENTIDLELDKEGAYNVDILSAGKEIKMSINGGGNSAISITQSN